MRMRKKKHAEDRLEACKEYIYAHEGDALTDPSYQIYGEKSRVFLEIGAGKGGFAVGMVKQNPDAAYFAMERVTDCVVLAAESAKRAREEENSCKNLKFIIDTADNLTKLFAPESVDATNRLVLEITADGRPSAAYLPLVLLGK